MSSAEKPAKKPPRKPPTKKIKPPIHSRIDREGLERDYRLGKLSIHELAMKYEVADKTVHNLAKAGGWTRDLGETVRAMTRAKMIEQAAAAPVTATVEAMADEVAKNVEVLTRHRTLAGGLRELCSRLTEELVGQSGDPETLQQLLVAVGSADEFLGMKLQQAISLPARVGSLDKLAGALAKLVQIERQAHAIDADKEDGGVEGFLRQLATG